MKQERGGWRPLRHEEMYVLRNEDSYKQAGKQTDARCPSCSAFRHAGRWTWKAYPDIETEQLCPACQRIHDDQPAGEVLIKGGFYEQHRDEVLHLIRRTEDHEKPEHPLERLMRIEPSEGALLVSTTGMHLARCIGEALNAAYKGEVAYHYRDADGMVQVVWSR